MTWLLHAITREHDPIVENPDDWMHNDAFPHVPQVVASPPLAAIVSPWDTNDARDATAKALLFARGLHILNLRGAILPARFGTIVPDRLAVETMLCDQRRFWVRALDRIDNGWEWTIHVFCADPPPEALAEKRPTVSQPIGPGRAFLEQRRAQMWGGDAHLLHNVAPKIVADMSGFLKAHRFDREPAAEALSSQPTSGIRICCLTSREQSAAFLDHIARHKSHWDAHVTVTGPWPPASFLDIGEI